MKYLIHITFFLLTSHFAFGQSWLTPWENRQVLTTTNFNYLPAEDYQVRLEIGYIAGMQTSFDDIRFTNNTGNEVLPYWIEHIENDTAVVWVQLDSINAFTTQDFYLYFGNSAATSESNPYETFIYYDDFDTDQGWNIIGGSASTQLTTIDTTSTLNKYDFCAKSGAWINIGDTIPDFKLITRDYMPSTTESGCTKVEYGVETEDFEGFNLIREAMGDTLPTDFGLHKRDQLLISDVTTVPVVQPTDNWYYTMVSYCHICQFNLHATIRNGSMDMIGEVYNYNYSTYDFSKFTIRGGYDYHLDYVAVARNLCIEPQIAFAEIESCPTVNLINFADDHCDQGLGEIELSISGGLPPYTLSWYDGEDSLGVMTVSMPDSITIDSLSAGQYCFKILDAAGCEN